MSGLTPADEPKHRQNSLDIPHGMGIFSSLPGLSLRKDDNPTLRPPQGGDLTPLSTQWGGVGGGVKRKS